LPSRSRRRTVLGGRAMQLQRSGAVRSLHGAGGESDRAARRRGARAAAAPESWPRWPTARPPSRRRKPSDQRATAADARALRSPAGASRRPAATRRAARPGERAGRPDRVRRVIDATIDYFTTDATGAAFDSELALVQWNFYSRAKSLPNPMRYKGARADMPPIS